MECCNIVCSKTGNLWCSACKASSYCSGVCQKLDWRARHRVSCPLMMLPPTEVFETVASIADADRDTTCVQYIRGVPGVMLLYKNENMAVWDRVRACGPLTKECKRAVIQYDGVGSDKYRGGEVCCCTAVGDVCPAPEAKRSFCCS